MNNHANRLGLTGVDGSSWNGSSVRNSRSSARRRSWRDQNGEAPAGITGRPACLQARLEPLMAD
jgi:hypothetical protein